MLAVAPIVAVATLAAAPPAAERAVGPEVFLRPRGFFLGPHATITLPVLDGGFTSSRRAVARRQLIDVSLRGPGGPRPLDRATSGPRQRDSRLLERQGPSTGDPSVPHPKVRHLPAGRGRPQLTTL